MSVPPTRLSRRPRSPRVNVLGIAAGYHDSSCCLFQDGVLVAAAQEERFTRIKNDRSFPRHALRYCLAEAGLSLGDVDCAGYYEDPVQKLGRQLWSATGPGLSAGRRREVFDRATAPLPQESIRRISGYRGPIEIVDHHLSHAASSFFCSGFEEAAILTVDGVGDWPTTTYGVGRGPAIERFEQVDFPHSLGFLYSAVTGYLGFEVNEGEYKVMGLAPYGEPRYADRIARLVEVLPGGQYRLDLAYFGFLDGETMYSPALAELLGQPPREPESELGRFHLDVARSVQAVLEEVLLEKVRYLHTQVPVEDLCMAGGVALNVVANSRILREGPFERLFVQPAAGDAGGAVGAAAVAHARLTGERPRQQRLEHTYLGPAATSREVHGLLAAASAEFLDFQGREADLLEHVASELSDGKVVGWFQGRMEFGPRSLGARSILADARHPGMRDRINRLVKMRESFRPFAPAVLESRAAEHFDLDHPSAFMLETCAVTSPLDLPSITHVDGSARVQTVNRRVSPRFAGLLEAFDRRTGCPVLVNTSFNVRGEPVVCSPLDALRCFVRSEIDVLVLEDFVLDRSAVRALWELDDAMPVPMGRADTGEAVEHLVYTLI
ncbi:MULTISPECIES: carbamoyltransferase family protein [unclassified Streptomyces]|uniref:carbamoyltransferase family protein n=1 Tax=unclassified Streptomyces TaxID=2593676 RepID=UPI002E2CB27B|nr:carbamoyltransferase N-terminal domain-containing protein [Streptomyces sp. NBC_00223]